MIVLPTLRKLLKDGLAPPDVHTAALFTPPGALISYATRVSASPAQPHRAFSKDDVRLLIGLASEVWAEARPGGGIGMAECELGRIVVVPVYSANQLDAISSRETSPNAPSQRDTPERDLTPNHEMGPEPLLLLAVQGSIDADWDQLLASAQGPAEELAGPLSSYGDDLLLREDSPPIAAK